MPFDDVESGSGNGVQVGFDCMREVGLSARRPHVTFQGLILGLVEIDQDQPVDHIAEFRIAVEGQEFAAEIHVMLEQDRNAVQVSLDREPH